MEKIGKAYSVLEGHIVMAGGGMNFCGLSDFVTRTFFPDMSSVILDQRNKGIQRREPLPQRIC